MRNQLSHIRICCKDVLLGYKVPEWTKYLTENVIILYVKKYVYDCTMNDTTLNLIACKTYQQIQSIANGNFKYRSEYDSIIEFTTDCL